MEQLFGVLFFAGIIALGFYFARKNKSDTVRTPKIGGTGIIDKDDNITPDPKE
jgi:hypothetical protein